MQAAGSLSRFVTAIVRFEKREKPYSHTHKSRQDDDDDDSRTTNNTTRFISIGLQY